MPFDPYRARSQFPALRREVDGLPAVYLDGPGGTQVPEPVIEAMAAFMTHGGSNLGGPFVTSRETDLVTTEARRAMADLFGAQPGEIVFGQNMTSLTLAMSRALGATWRAGDNVVLSRLDHDANVWPWVLAARDAGVEVRWVDFVPEDGCALDTASLRAALDERTRLVAVTHASNAVGTVVDVRLVSKLAHDVGALSYVDAVHYTPHGTIDVAAIGCDFLVASAYKFFGPHTGVLFGRRHLLETIDAYKIRPAPDTPPGKWESGTQSFESLAGVTAAVDYLASLAEGDDRRASLVGAMADIAAYERDLAKRFIEGAGKIDGIRIYGITDDRPRTPTFAIEVEGLEPVEVAAALGAKGIFVWAGHYYALEVMDRLGVLERGGLVRIGFVHYTTPAEVDRVLEALSTLASGASLDDVSTFQPLDASSLVAGAYHEYTMSDLPDPRSASRSRLAEGLGEIIAIEGPMTAYRSFQLFVRASGGRKVTKPVREDLEWALELLVEQGKVESEHFSIDGEDAQTVVRRTGMPRVTVRELGPRDLYEVPLSEVAEVAGVLRRLDPEADRESMKRAVLEWYGLKRLTESASRYLDASFRLAGI